MVDYTKLHLINLLMFSQNHLKAFFDLHSLLIFCVPVNPFFKFIRLFVKMTVYFSDTVATICSTVLKLVLAAVKTNDVYREGLDEAAFLNAIRTT